MEFCPSCGMFLQIESARDGHRMRLFCPSCPYVSHIQNKIVKKVKLVRKETEPVFSGADAMKYAQRSKATCPSCHHDEAYFWQMQTRSADEPMTVFYKCCNDKCNHNWRED